AGEDDLTVGVAVVGEGKRAGRWNCVMHGQAKAGPCAGSHGRTAVLRAGGELEGKTVIGLLRQRLRADLLQLRGDVVAGEPLAVRSGETPFEPLGRERFDVGARLRRRLGKDADGRSEEEREE